MKKFNKVLSVVVASAMVMAMAGCGNTDNGSAATGTNAATESAAADNGAASGSVFKIGGLRTGCTAWCRDRSRRDQCSRWYQRLSGRVQVPG